MVSNKKTWHLNILSLMIVSWLLAACQPVVPLPVAPPATAAAAQVSPSAVPTPSASSPAPAPTETPLPSATPTIQPWSTVTPDPYAGLSVLSLASRTYGGGEVQIQEVLAVNSFFTRTLISYPSDGLAIYGFMNVPTRGEAPFPVVIALHGYIDPEVYTTVDYTTRYADALARSGFLVLHPNLRGYPPSDEGENLFRVGMAVDVLNLIAIVKAQAGKPGALAQANPQAIGLWGHSMGGGIATRVVTLSRDVRAVLLYGAMSGDEQKNFERIFTYFSGGLRGQEELSYPPEAYLAISPVYYLDRIRAAIHIHHGEKDADVPLAWPHELCDRLLALGKPVECYFYPDQAHTFSGEGDELFIQRSIHFFRRILAPQPNE